jgi:hypothetical protein
MLSISAWHNFILQRLLTDAIFPPIAVLIAFAVFNRKEYRNTPLLRFILTAIVITLISVYAFFVHMEMKINTRHLYAAAFYGIILCVPGFPIAVRLLKHLTRIFPRIKETHLTVFLLLAISIACIGKALHPPDRKFYIQDTAKIIKDSKYPVSPILISNIEDDRRVAWQSNAELLPLSSVADINNPVFFENALNVLRTKNKNIFLLVQFSDAEFRRCFSNKNVKFPAKLMLLKEFRTKQKIFYSLYKAGLPEKVRETE